MTDHARDDRAREIDTAALNGLMAALRSLAFGYREHAREVAERLGHGSDEQAADECHAEYMDRAAAAIRALLDEIDRLRAENERLRHDIERHQDIITAELNKDEPQRLRSTIPNRHIPIRPLEDEK